MWKIAGVIFCAGILAPTATFDLSVDFSLQKNPNHMWQYGYSATHSLDPAEFRLAQYAHPIGPVGFWHAHVSHQPGPGWYPYIAFNSTNQSQLGSANGWAVRPGEVAMEASNTGQYSLVRFVAPKSGTYDVTARFEGVHFGLSTTDVHVLHNAESLFDAEIEGYGGDPAFHQVQGANPAASYSGRVDLVENDTVTFAVGYGKNKTHYSDTTGLFARVVLLSARDVDK